MDRKTHVFVYNSIGSATDPTLAGRGRGTGSKLIQTYKHIEPYRHTYIQARDYILEDIHIYRRTYILIYIDIDIQMYMQTYMFYTHI